MSDAITVFVNAHRVEVAPGTTVLGAVRAWSEEAAQAVQAGSRVACDARGLPVAPDTPVHSGSILRLVRARGPAASGTSDVTS